jgi:Flp pilus assembly protein TadG
MRASIPDRTAARLSPHTSRWRGRRRERGAAAVEFALVLPLFIALLMGSIDYGYYFFSEQVVTNAAREGARAGSLVAQGGALPTAGAQSTAISNARTAAQTYMQKGGVTCPGTCVTATYVTVGGSPTIDVVIDYPYAGLTGFTGSALPRHVYAHAAMRWQ